MAAGSPLFLTQMSLHEPPKKLDQSELPWGLLSTFLAPILEKIRTARLAAPRLTRHANLKFLFLRSQPRICNSYLAIVRSTRHESHRQQALDNALQAYTTVHAYLPGAVLTEQERIWFASWVEQTERTLESITGIPLTCIGGSEALQE
jgi:hypothetical protein